MDLVPSVSDMTELNELGLINEVPEEPGGADRGGGTGATRDRRAPSRGSADGGHLRHG
jgi:hypothetical protein